MHRCNGELGQLLMARRPGVAELANGGRVAVRQGDHETPWSLRRPGVHLLGIAMGRPGVHLLGIAMRRQAGRLNTTEEGLLRVAPARSR